MIAPPEDGGIEVIDYQAFLEERKTGIGGSDCASLFNVGYGCRRRLWYEKNGATPDFPRDESDVMQMGKILEPWIIHRYSYLTKRDVCKTPPMQRHRQHKFLVVHADALVRDRSRGVNDERGVLECKAFGREVFYKVKRAGMVDDYILQLQHGMLVFGLNWGSFATCCRDNGAEHHFDSERDKDICEAIEANAIEFWAKLKDPNGPKALDPDDDRCQNCEYRRTCQGARFAGIVNTKKLESDESLRPLLTEYLTRKGLESEAEALVKETKAELEASIGERTAVSCAGYNIYFGKQQRMLWKTDDMAAEISRLSGKSPDEVTKEYQQPGKEFRALRVY
jgi:predicted phage-related endonuclease